MTVKLSRRWYDDPEGTYERVVNRAIKNFGAGVISGFECSLSRRTAEQCRAQVYAERAAAVERGADR